MNNRLLPFIGLIAIAAIASGTLKNLQGPPESSTPESSTYERCADPTSPFTKKALEQEYTGERPKGSWEKHCQTLKAMGAVIREQERFRQEYRAKNP